MPDLLTMIEQHPASELARARLRVLGVELSARTSPLVQLVAAGLEGGLDDLSQRADALCWERDQAAAVMMLVGDYETLLSDLMQVVPGEEWAAVEPHLSDLEGQIASAAAPEDELADNLNCNLGLVYPGYGL